MKIERSGIVHLVLWMWLLGGCYFTSGNRALAQGDGLIEVSGKRAFPIGFYELPASAAGLEEMAENGVNLIKCSNREDLDRVAAAGMKGWIVLGVQQGATDDLRKRIEAVKDHPALAVWEGPDEIIWTFTAYSVLYRTHNIYKYPDEWWRQTPLAMEYSEERGNEILPKIRAAIELVRSLDGRNLQFWINEARDSDVKWVREYLDHIDITGCDYYPIKGKHREAIKMGKATDRWMKVGKGKPVWMVLQAFSYHQTGEPGTFYWSEETYPSFDESRLMAYVSIVYGAKGLIYWGSFQKVTAPAFRQSLYALTSELSALQPFLIGGDQTGVSASVIEGRSRRGDPWPPPLNLGVRCVAKRTGRDWLVILVNEDDRPHYGVVVSGLEDLNGQSLKLLYGEEVAKIKHGEFITRIKPFEVKVFASNQGWETERRKGRDYAGIFVE